MVEEMRQCLAAAKAKRCPFPPSALVFNIQYVQESVRSLLPESDFPSRFVVFPGHGQAHVRKSQNLLPKVFKEILFAAMPEANAAQLSNVIKTHPGNAPL